MSVDAGRGQCRLCGLDAGGEEFCCPGCQNVYAILEESGALASGADPRDTDLFRRSLEMGLVARRPAAAAAARPPAEETRESVLHVTGMWCAACAWLIERALLSENGVVAAEVMFASDLVRIRYDPRAVPPGRLRGRIERLGYGVAGDDGPATDASTRIRRDLLLRTGLAAFLWLNVMTLSLIFYVSYFETVSERVRGLMPFVLMALTAPAILYSGWPVLRIAALGLREGVLRMESLLALGILAAFGYSSAEAFRGGRHFYFDTACALITMVLAGKLIEAGAKARTTRAVALLHQMMPRKARVLAGGRERFLAVEQLAPGARFLVKPGERIPADGVVEEGSSAVDESLLTGESAPRSRGPGDSVIGGSLAVSGALTVRATAAAGEGALAGMIRTVGRALASRASIEHTVDRVSRAFVPAVVLFSAAVLGFWLAAGAGAATALSNAICVLVVACPCALGIATPLALTAAIGTASRHGILVNHAAVLETTRRVGAVVFDKTGTVTEGEFRLLRVEPRAGVSAAEVVRIIASLESRSEHALARAVVEYADSLGLAREPVADFERIEGAGVTGVVGGRRAFAGNRRIAPGCPEPHDGGGTVVWCGWDGEVKASLVFGERIRPEAAETIRRLHGTGVETWIVSGDSEAVTRSVAEAVGIRHWRAEALPAAKIEVIDALRAEGKTVAMVGDGINDAPALAHADLGIAMSTGTALAMQAAPMVLMAPKLDRIPLAFDLAHRTLRVIRLNLFWAFLYNILGITLAAAGLLNPILATGAMTASGITVVGLSLQLGRARLGAAESSAEAALGEPAAPARRPSTT